MAVFHAAMWTQCILLVVTCFLGDAHFICVDNYNRGLLNQKIITRRFVRDVSSELQNHNGIENNFKLHENSSISNNANVTNSISGHPNNSTLDINTTTVQITDLNEPINHFHTIVTNTNPESENPSTSIPTPNAKDSSVQMTSPNKHVLIHESNITTPNYNSTSEELANSTIGPKLNVTLLHDSINNNSNLSNKNISLESEDSLVSSTAPNAEVTDIELPVSIQPAGVENSNLTIENYSSTSERSSIDSNLNSTTLLVGPNNNSTKTNANIVFGIENPSVSTPASNVEVTDVEMPVPRERSSIDSNLNSTTLQVGPIDNSNVTNANISLDVEDLSVSTPAPNVEVTNTEITFSSEPTHINNSNVTIRNYSLTSERSPIDPHLNLTNQNLLNSTSDISQTTIPSDHPSFDSSNETINNYSSTTETSSTTTLESHSDATTFKAKTTDNFDITYRNRNLGSKNPLVSKPKNENLPSSTPAPSIEIAIVLKNFQTELTPVDKFDKTTIKNASIGEEISTTTPAPIIDTTSIAVTVSSNSNDGFNVVNSNNSMQNNSSSISPEKSPMDKKGKTNQTLVIENPNDFDISVNKDSTSTESKVVEKQNCTSVLKFALSDSFTEVIVEIDVQLIDLFIEALNKSFLEVYDPSETSLLTRFSTLIDENQNNIDILANDTLLRVSEEKSSVLKIINDHKLLSKSNDTILKMFEEIEDFVRTFNLKEDRDYLLRNEALLNIKNLIKISINESLFSIKRKAVAELYETHMLRNSHSRITTIVDNFLDYTQFYEQKFSPKSNLFSEMILDLMEEVTNFKDNFMENFQYSWIDLLVKVEDEDKRFDHLSSNVSNILENVINEMQNLRINRFKNAKIYKNHDQLEQSVKSTLSNFSDPVRTLLNESMQFSLRSFDVLKNLPKNASYIANIYGDIIGIFVNTTYSLQKEVPALLDINFFSQTISLDASELNEMFESAAKSAFKDFYRCEGDNYVQQESVDDNEKKITNYNHYERTDEDISVEDSTSTNNTSFSTSGGHFIHHIQCSLMFISLVYYGVMLW